MVLSDDAEGVASSIPPIEEIASLFDRPQKLVEHPLRRWFVSRDLNLRGSAPPRPPRSRQPRAG